MNAAEVRDIVQTVLSYDLEPPSEDYSPYDHGSSLARTLSKDSAAALVAECFRALPASLASSFLEGLLDNFEVPSLADTLLAVLPSVREVTSAGAVVGIMLDRCGLDPTNLAVRLLTMLQGSADEHLQNLLAFGIWSIPRTTIYGAGPPDRKIWGPNDDANASLEAAIRATKLDEISEYARQSLEPLRRSMIRRAEIREQGDGGPGQALYS